MREPPTTGGSIIGPEAVTLVCTATATATAHHTRTTGQEPRKAGAGAPTREPEHRREGRDRWPKNPARAAKEAGDGPEHTPGRATHRHDRSGRRKTPRESGAANLGGTEHRTGAEPRTALPTAPPVQLERSGLQLEYNRQVLTCQGVAPEIFFSRRFHDGEQPGQIPPPTPSQRACRQISFQNTQQIAPVLKGQK